MSHALIGRDRRHIGSSQAFFSHTRLSFSLVDVKKSKRFQGLPSHGRLGLDDCEWSFERRAKESMDGFLLKIGDLQCGRSRCRAGLNQCRNGRLASRRLPTPELDFGLGGLHFSHAIDVCTVLPQFTSLSRLPMLPL